MYVGSSEHAATGNSMTNSKYTIQHSTYILTIQEIDIHNTGNGHDDWPMQIHYSRVIQWEHNTVAILFLSVPATTRLRPCFMIWTAHSASPFVWWPGLERDIEQAMNRSRGSSKILVRPCVRRCTHARLSTHIISYHISCAQALRRSRPHWKHERHLVAMLRVHFD